jgi:O-antigen ligase
MLVLLLLGRKDSVKFPYRKALIIVTFVLSLVLLTSTMQDVQLGQSETMISLRTYRFSLTDPSGETHLSLVKGGLELAFSNTKRFLIGTGFGAEYSLAIVHFPNITVKEKYANFHSNVISILVQTGILGWLCWLGYTFILPFSWGLRKKFIGASALSALAGAYLVGGVFYQYYVEPSYWIAVTLANLSKAIDKERVR